MSIDSTKSWIAIGRRHDQDISLVDAYSELFEAMCWSNDKMPLPIVDTVIFQRLSMQYYSYDWPQQRLLPVTSVTTPSAALRQFISNDEGNSISAVWLTEVKDTKGYLISVEYLTVQDLLNFFHTGDTKKVGVLQRYVYPRPFRHVDEVAQEVIVHYTHGRSITVERRLGNHPLDSMTEHPTVRGNLFPPLPTFGKILARTQPFTAAECRYGQQGERIFDNTYVSVCNNAVQFVVSALENYRRTCAVDEGRISPNGGIGGAYGGPTVRPVSTMTLQLRQSFHDSQVYFISVLALRHPADRFHVDVQYEFVRVPQEGTIYIQSPLSPGELDISTFNANQKQNISVPSAVQQHPHHEGDEEEDEDDPNRYSPHRRAQDPDLYACPNCDRMHHRDDFVRMEFREIFDWYLKQCSKDHSKTQPSKRSGSSSKSLDMYNSGSVVGGGGLQQRPASASIHKPAAAATGSFRALRPQSAKYVDGAPNRCAANNPLQQQQAVILTTSSVNTKVPPVLARLNVPVADLAQHPVRLRSVPLCADCATEFGATVVSRGVAEQRPSGRQSPTDSTNQEVSPDRSPRRSASPHDRYVAAMKVRLQEAPPTCLRSEVIDQMVITPLQEQHRYQRQGERIKYETKVRDLTSKQKQEVDTLVIRSVEHEEQELDRMLDMFAVRDTMRVAATARTTTTVSSSTSVTVAVDADAASSPNRRPLSQATPRRAGGGGDAAPSSSAADGGVDVDVLTTGPDMPLQILLQNDLYYKLMQVVDADPADGVSMTPSSSMLKPVPRPSIVVPSEDIDIPARQYLKRVQRRCQSGRRICWNMLKQVSTTFSDMTDEERLLMVQVVGGDTNRALPYDDLLPPL